MSLTYIPHIIPVLSGKGGVGKSSVTVQLALTLTLHGYNVGVLDIDLTGPSIPRLFGIEQAKIRQAPGGWLPVEVYPAKEHITAHAPSNGDNPTTTFTNACSGRLGALHCMSLGFLLASRNDAVIWRGPKKTAMVNQLLESVLWPQDLDYLLIDTPPGTSDEHISLVTRLLNPTKIPDPSVLGAVIVTTPQAISTADVKKELSFCKKTQLRVLGVVENMVGYVCPCCGEVTNVFSKGGGEVMAREWNVRFLGSVPIDGEGWSMLVEEGKRPVYSTPKTIEAQDDAATATATAPADALQGKSLDGVQESMAEKYTSCSLFAVFKDLIRPIVDPEDRTSTAEG